MQRPFNGGEPDFRRAAQHRAVTLDLEPPSGLLCFCFSSRSQPDAQGGARAQRDGLGWAGLQSLAPYPYKHPPRTQVPRCGNAPHPPCAARGALYQRGGAADVPGTSTSPVGTWASETVGKGGLGQRSLAPPNGSQNPKSGDRRVYAQPGAKV
ncbi:hypothetical protein MKX07_000114 [Trichoderma sp. CBMAI-0711]|nr:hypothetical protein MKX07_000114 [Trichoderma sp. CBMAI-0711]